MLKIRALNQESSSDEDVPTVRREAQEEIALELYNKALRTQAKKDYDTSSNILTQLLQDNIPQLENNGGLPKSMSTLKYSCYMNLGNIYLNQDNISRALENFTNASELDSSDVTLWAKIGKLSLKEDKFNKAAYAFSKGLECSESHWPCLDNLISVLYAIKDTISCLVYIGKALMLDAEYTKGVVLRKQIYKDNPATREYYQLYNADHIWEPLIDIEVDKEDEDEILKEAQLLCDRVTEVAKALEPKPLDTIPLPTALEEYTWLSLARTIVHCHQYITDNNMSHFTFFDMSKCMSQSGECAEIVPGNKIVEDVNIIKDNKSSETKSAENSVEANGSAGKMQTEPVIMERRFSQNSENTTGNDNQDNTPVQTDNDEEQNMELDNDNETEGDNTDTTQQRRKGKRKRDVLSDLQIWGWHSKRKPPKKSNRDFTVEDALNRIIPKSLLKTKITNELLNQGGEDSMNTMDIYNMYVENKELTFLSPIHSPKSVNFEAYFGTDHERDDVLHFWTKERLRIDAIVLVKELVFELSKLWRYKWPKELIPLYIEIYKMFREHCDQPQPFCGDHSFEQIRDDALATLLYGELISFSSDNVEALHPTILSYLQIVSGWNEHWKEENSSFFIRFYWLQSHCFRRSDENELAIRALEVTLEEISAKEADTSDRFTLSLSNCFKYGFISRDIIEKIIKHLNMIIQMGNIENLFNSQKYAEVAEILKHTFHSGTYPKVGRMGRPAQLGILMHSLWFTDWDECFIFTEECLHEAVSNYGKPNAEHDKWEKIIEKCLGITLEIIKRETVIIIDKLTEEKRCRLVESLAKVVCKQQNTEGVSSIPLGSISAWILLHYVLLREEHRQYAHKRLTQSKRDRMEILKENTAEPSEDELPPSIAILFSAHEFLGPKGWCLTGNGELLHFILDTILDRLDTPIFEPLRDKIDIHIEQALFCLYLYPSKNNKISRHLVDHSVNPIPLTWQRSFQLYQYYAPESLPEFNSYKNQSIAADLKQLFKRIIDLVPPSYSADDYVVKITDFIHGKTQQLPECLEFPGRVRAIYYLLGDYYFKEKHFAKCIKYFQQDLCINPMRLDAWASLGLSYSAQLDNSLNLCEKLKNEADFFDKAKSAQVCFRKALELDPENLMLWIECGSFEYMVHSFCSRLIKYESENFSMEKFELLESEKESYLDSSGNSLEHAISLYEINDSNEPDERWLQYYILGKIAEKKRKEPAEYLQYYMTANTLLSENKATYPDKINYNNPQHLSVEALELHYRIHASVLKYMELHEGKDVTNTMGAFFKKCLHSTAKRYVVPPPTPLPISKPQDGAQIVAATATGFQDVFLNSIKNPRNNEIGEEDAEEIVKKCLEGLLDKVDELIKKKDCNETPNPIDEPCNKVSEDSSAKADNSAESDDLDVTIIENEEEVIMIISDSEDETLTPNQEVTEVQRGDNVFQEKVASKETKMEVEESVEDVQSVLDKMMEQTMKDIEKLDDSDPNNSGAEQMEVVATREDVVDLSKDEMAQPKETDKPGTSRRNISDNLKNKPSDSETDTDNKKTTADEDTSSSSSSSSSETSSSDSDSDDSDSSSSSSTSDSTSENMSHSDTLQLVDKCIQGLEVCIIRLPQNYKALYRLAHVFFNYKGRKDYTKCKQLLLGQYKCKDDVAVAGLFADRNIKNFFNGIWRIPSTEIDRPGSLAAHMNRCLSILLQVLRNTNDTKTLMELYTQLKKVPDKDKIYIKDNDRIGFSEQAMDMCIQCFRAQIKNIPNMQHQQVTRLLHDIFRAYQRVQKHIPTKESTFSGLLADAYKQYIKENIPDNVNVLDLAVKFCQQHKALEKQKSSIQHLPSTFTHSRSPGNATPPVHPSPSTLVPPQKPLKPPNVGRPRGRPPLPKLPGQIRQSRAKSPIASAYPWQNPMYGANINYEYLKHYQDELIKQYSQNLSLSQLQQLTSFFSTGQLSNPAVAQAVANQFMTQTGLINPSARLSRPPSSGVGTGAIPTHTTSSFLDPNLMSKGFNAQLSPALSNLTPEQMKFLETMLPNMAKQTSVSKSNPSAVKSSSSSSVSSSKTSGNLKVHSTVPNVKTYQGDYSKMKTTNSGVKTSDEKSTTANLLMKERPNISITPVGSLPVASTTNNSNQLLSKPGQSTTSIMNSLFSKSSLSAATHTVSSFGMSKQQSSGLIATKHSKTKSAYVPTITSSTAFSKPIPMPIPQPTISVSAIQAPAAHSSVSPKSAHALPVTPPPVSSPSFIKAGLSTSPGKTLQEKLADKKKEQETKHMMKNIGAEIFATKAPPPTSSANLLKGLNLPNIPSSLSVSPSTPMPYPMSLGLEKQPAFSKFPKSKSSAQAIGIPVEHKLPPNLTVSKSLPPSAPVYTPRFPTDSGISISQLVAGKTKAEKQPPRTVCPVSLDESVEISPVLLQAKGSSTSSKSSKDQTKRAPPHTASSGGNIPGSNSASSKLKISTKPGNLFGKESSHSRERDINPTNVEDIIRSKSGIKITRTTNKPMSANANPQAVISSSRRNMEKSSPKHYNVENRRDKETTSAKNAIKRHHLENKALSVIKNLSSIDLTPLPSKVTCEDTDDEDVICLD